MISKEIHSNLSIPPGELLKEIIDYEKLNKTSLLQKLDLSKEDFNKLLKGRIKLDKALAKKLNKVTNVPIHIWLGLENEYRKINGDSL